VVRTDNGDIGDKFGHGEVVAEEFMVAVCVGIRRWRFSGIFGGGESTAATWRISPTIVDGGAGLHKSSQW
jgi:hypothetical protein